MSLRRWFSRSAVIVALVACSDDDAPTAPPGALVDVFGGSGVGLVATATVVRFQTPCGEIRFPGALVPGTAGAFSLGPVIVPAWAGGRNAMALRGTLTGLQMEVNVRVLTGTAETSSTRFNLRRGQAPDFDGWSCAANASAGTA
jgi:hypothetical protein